MKLITQLHYVLFFSILFTLSCVSKKDHLALQTKLKNVNTELENCNKNIDVYKNRLVSCEAKVATLENQKQNVESTLKIRQEQINDLKNQVSDVRKVRDKQLEQVGDLTVLSKSANENIKETLGQLEKKDKYINRLREARNKADSINLALAVNLKSVLSEGLDDTDIKIEVDKTVVFVNLSDKMLFRSGSAVITSKANSVLGKIARIIESRPELEVMVEGYTDSRSIKTSCIKDNWDLSVKRATSVVRVLQTNYGVSPARLIAAGRGEYLPIADNATPEGRSINRRTRIVILPKLDQFYDLLKPEAN